MVSITKKKIWVLRENLKTPRKEACLMCNGRFLHIFGATTAKAQPAFSLQLILGALQSS